MFTGYVTPEEAKTLITTYRGSAAADAFTDMPEQDQAALLMGAQLIIERYRFKGHQRDIAQESAFPRIINGHDVGIPDRIKLAIALHVADQKLMSKEATATADLRKAGVSRYHLDDFDVSFDNTAEKEALMRGGLSDDAYGLILPYLLRGGPLYVYE